MKALRLSTWLPLNSLLLLICATMANGQAIAVIADTNQIRLIPSSVNIEWRTNLYTAVTHTFVTTNWMPVGQPVDIITNGIVIQRRQYEAATLLTNVSHRMTYEGVERVWTVSQSLGPVLATRHYDLPPPLPTSPFLAVPTRQPR